MTSVTQRHCRHIWRHLHANRGLLGTHTVVAPLSSATESTSPELLEMREYTLKPEGIKPFMALTNDMASLRSQLLPFLGMFSCDTGGTLNRVVHFYNYSSLEARDAARQATAAHGTWQTDYLDHSRTHVAHQTSSLWLPALPVMHAARVVPAGQFASPPRPPPGSPPVMYELRAYELTHGWGAVPSWVDAMADGLPSKLAAADPAEAPVLVFAGYSDAGPMNCTMELWRHPSAAACMRARVASRSATAWRQAVTEVAKVTQRFTVSYLHPVACSPWQ